ncbi:MAG TPA: hypothetical protein VGJ00_10135 [Rhabdochlamydiaceae bacterium]|jgi:hypothetical protein
MSIKINPTKLHAPAGPVQTPTTTPLETRKGVKIPTPTKTRPHSTGTGEPRKPLTERVVVGRYQKPGVDHKTKELSPQKPFQFSFLDIENTN